MRLEFQKTPNKTLRVFMHWWNEKDEDYPLYNAFNFMCIWGGPDKKDLDAQITSWEFGMELEPYLRKKFSGHIWHY